MRMETGEKSRAKVERREMLLKMFGQKIVDLRETKGWSRKELAAVLKVNWNSLGRWERGERRPPLSMLVHLNEIFGAPMHEIALSEPMMAPEVMKEK